MNKIEGMIEDFKQVKIVYITTFSKGEEKSRSMTNFNDDPYSARESKGYRGKPKGTDNVSKLQGGGVL